MTTPSTSAQLGNTLSYEDGLLSLSEILSALTFALDLTEGAVPGHALRSCLLGMRLAAGLGLPAALRCSLYYALLLKDCGCSSNAARMYQIVGGDDRELKATAKLANPSKPGRPDRRTAKRVWAQVAPGASLPRRTLRLLQIVRSQGQNTSELIAMRCNRGAQIMRRLEMDDAAAEAVMHLDEYWDGTGHPERLRGEAIPLMARICSVAQNLDVFFTEYGAQTAIAVLHVRAGTWFDPELVRVAESLHREGTLWQQCAKEDLESTRHAVLDLDPGTQVQLSSERVDRICEAFAEVVDAKSPFTFRHSVGVAEVAAEIAREMGFAPARVQVMRRAGLLHDLGKLRVPNSILDKPGKLDAAEWEVIALHPGLSRSILERVSAFRELAVLAGEHHEKLDGRGYPDRLTAVDLSMESRLLAIADVFTALAEDRSYRPGFALDRSLGLLGEHVPHGLDGDCFEALRAASSRWPGKRPAAAETPEWSELADCNWQPAVSFAGG